MKKIIENKVKEFLYNEIFNIEGMDVWELRQMVLSKMYDVIEKEVDEFIKNKDIEE
jgi:DNA-binding protein Fis